MSLVVIESKKSIQIECCIVKLFDTVCKILTFICLEDELFPDYEYLLTFPLGIKDTLALEGLAGKRAVRGDAEPNAV